MYEIASHKTRIDKKLSYKYFVIYDRDSKKVNFQNTLDCDDDIEISNMEDNNAENLYAKVAPFIKKYIYDKLVMVDHLPCNSIH